MSQILFEEPFPMTLKSFTAVACLSLASASSLQATTFDFFWSADPAADTTINSSNDPTATAIGRFDIHVANGAAFTATNVTNIYFKVSGATFNDFSFSSLNIVNGTVSADGSSASLSNIFFLGGSNGIEFFGCNFTDCHFGDIFVRDHISTGVEVRYSDKSAAQASLHVTAVSAVPLPAGGLLLLSGLGGVAALKRRKKSTA